jgi:PST family polysaccharide transporter
MSEASDPPGAGHRLPRGDGEDPTDESQPVRPSRLDVIALDTDDDRVEVFEDVTVRRSSVAVSARWSLVGLLAKQVSRIGFSVLLARLLGPESFGIIGQATIYLTLSSVLLDVGLASALIQRKEIDRDLIGTATSLNLIAVSALVVATQVTAGLWAAFFSTAELETVLRVLSIDFVLSGIAVVPMALLTRRLDFRTLAIAEVVSTVVGGVLGVAAALGGAEYWSLVVQTLARDLVFAAIVIAAVGRPFLGWSRRALRAILGFSSRVFGSQALNFLNQNADNTLVAWRLGATALANYALSYRVLLLPVQVLSQTANRIVFPVLSRLNDDPPKQARHYLTASASLSLAVTPLMVLVALGAPRGVPLVFGPEWEAAIVPMQILALASILRAVLSVGGGVVLARGRADWALRWSIVTTALLIGGFAVGLQWGINGVAWSYLLVGFPLAVTQVLLIRRLIPYTFVGYLAAMAPAAAGALAMTGVWWIVMRSLDDRLGSFALLTIGSVATLVVFAGVVRVFWADVAREQIDFVRLMMRRGLSVSGSAASG